MKRSTDRILATHVGRLQRPDSITEKLVDRYAGKPVDQAALDAELTASVADVVRQQAEAGITVVNKILVPGVIGHATNTVEHPELVAWRIRLFAETVGKENVIAGADCGMGYRVHPQIAWAKLKALGEGARLASQALWLR